jgi:hypothetical protein
VNPEELRALIAKARAAGMKDEDIVRALQERGILDASGRPAQAAPPAPDVASPPSMGGTESFLRGAGQGLFRMGDEAEAGVRSALGPGSYEEELAKAQAANTQAAGNPASYNLGVGVGMGIPAAAAAMTLPVTGPAAIATAIAGGALTGMGEKNDMAHAAGGAAGGLAGYGAGSVVGRLGRGLWDVFHPENVARRALGNQLTPDMIERAAQQERLAPGTVVGADLSKETQKMARPLAQTGDGLASQALREAEARAGKIQEGLDQVATGYPQAGVPVHVTPALASTMARRGIMPPGDGVADATTLMTLRTNLRAAAAAAENRIERGAEQATDRRMVAQLKSDAQVITNELEQAIPGFRVVDRNYAILSEARRGVARTSRTLEQSMGTAAPNAVMGNQPTSAGGNLSTATGIFGNLLKAVSGKESNAKALYDVGLTPMAPGELQNMMARAQMLRDPKGMLLKMFSSQLGAQGAGSMMHRP